MRIVDGFVFALAFAFALHFRLGFPLLLVFVFGLGSLFCRALGSGWLPLLKFTGRNSRAINTPSLSSLYTYALHHVQVVTFTGTTFELICTGVLKQVL